MAFNLPFIIVNHIILNLSKKNGIISKIHSFNFKIFNFNLFSNSGEKLLHEMTVIFYET